VFLPDEVIRLAVMVKTHQNAGDRSSTSRPSVPRCKILEKFQLPKFGVRVCTERKTSRVLGFKSDAALSTFTFRFLFRFSSFFFFAEHILGIILVGKVFGKAFRIVGLDEERFFFRNFRVKVTFFATFSGLLD